MHNKTLRAFVAIFSISIATFLFFKGFFDYELSGLATEILAATLGALLTVLVTMLLLEKQSQTESASRASQAQEDMKYDKRLNVYREFIRFYAEAASDGVLTSNQLGKLEELALVIALIGDDDIEAEDDTPKLGEVVCQFVLQLQLFGLQSRLLPNQIDMWKSHFEERGYRPLSSSQDELDVLLQPCVIIQHMRWSLGQFDDEENHLDGFSFVQKLLDFRSYRNDGGNSVVE